MTWLKDINGNKCSVEYFGSKEAAQAALDSLENCENCINCSDCSRCSYIAWLISKKNLQGDPDAPEFTGPPPIPVIPDIHQAIYAAASAPGSLDMSDIHTCKKTHCRGGWAIALAGPAGHALENFYNWELAAMLIYDASDPAFKISPARFYDSNDDALADMKWLAEKMSA
jgi:hypothetical protein